MNESGMPAANNGLLSVTGQPLDLDLEFPDAPDFISKPPRISWEEIFALSEAALPEKLTDPNFYKERLLRKVTAEFIIE